MRRNKIQGALLWLVQRGFFFKHEHPGTLLRLAQPGALYKRLQQVDPLQKLNRIYVMGCGRSGTWLLYSLMSTFRGVELFPHEVPVEYFGFYKTNAPVLVLKRDQFVYTRIKQIPDEIKIAWIVRHPFDVLTSYNPTTGRKYHIKPGRWVGEMFALKYLVDMKRKNTKIVRYEDFVHTPALVQQEVSRAFDLEIEGSINEITARFKPSDETIKAMHGLRDIDEDSIGKYKKDPEKIEYLEKIKPRLGQILDWVAKEYSYDLDL